MKRCVVMLCLTILLPAAAMVSGSAASAGAWFPVWEDRGSVREILPNKILSEEALQGLKQDLKKEGGNPKEEEKSSIGSERKEIRGQLSQAGSTLIQIQMNGWTKVNDHYMSLSALEELARESMTALGDCSRKAEVTSDETDRMRQTNLFIEHGGVRYTIALHNGDQTYLTADAVIHDVTEAKETAVHDKLEGLLRRFEEGSCIRTTYTAAIPGKLDRDEMERISRQIFRGLKGTITEEIREAAWISKTGYSSKIGCALNSGGKRINLNVALRYNDYEDRTYVWLGTPVISIPY